MGKWVQWPGPPAPIAVAIGSAPTFLERPFRHDWMLRLLDVPAAFERRGYPPIDADVVFAWTIRVPGERGALADGGARRGVATVHSATPVAPVDPGGRALGAMYTGYLRPHDAVRLGYLDADDPSVAAFTRMLSGPDPWCPFFWS